MAAVVLCLSPGGQASEAASKPAASAPLSAPDGHLNLRKFASGVLNFTDKLAVDKSSSAVLTLHNAGPRGVTVSCKARRGAAGQLVLPQSLFVDSEASAQLHVTWTPSTAGEQRLSFDVCGSGIGRLPVQVNGCVVRCGNRLSRQPRVRYVGQVHSVCLSRPEEALYERKHAYTTSCHCITLPVSSQEGGRQPLASRAANSATVPAPKAARPVGARPKGRTEVPDKTESQKEKALKQPRASLIKRLSRKTHKAVDSSSTTVAPPRLSVLAKKRGSRAAAAAAYSSKIKRSKEAAVPSAASDAPAAKPRGRTSLGKAVRGKAAQAFIGLLRHLLDSGASAGAGATSSGSVARSMQRGMRQAAKHAPRQCVLDIQGGLGALNKSAKWRGKWDFGVTALYDAPLQRLAWSGEDASTSQPATLQWHQAAARVRQRAWKLLYASPLQEVAEAVARECEEGGWRVREDKPLHADLGLKDVLTHLLFHYHPAALRVALETVTGETIPFGPSSEVDGGYGALRRFIHHHLTFDADLQAQYEHTVSGVWAAEHAQRQNAAALARVLTVVLMLDALGTTTEGKGVLEALGVCAVFLPQSAMKDTRSVLIAVAREFLAAEGDVVKHASALGFVPRYKQSPLQELPYALPRSVKDAQGLADALRDGSRLARLAEVLSGEAPLSLVARTIRVPLTSRTTKVRNMKTLAQCLSKEFGLPLDATRAEAVANGRPEAAMAAVWAMVAHWAMPLMTPPWRVRKEVVAVLHGKPTAKAAVLAAPAAGKAGCSLTSLLAGVSAPSDLLLLWSQAVAATQGVRVTDWSRSWADGRALCALLRNYFPGHIPASAVAADDASLPSSAAHKASRARITAACAAAANVGCVPLLFPACDASCPPPPRPVMMFVTFLASSLLASAAQSRAVLKLQSAWRARARASTLVAQHHRAVLQRCRLALAHGKVAAWASTLPARRATRLRRQASTTIQRTWRAVQRKWRLRETALIARLLAAGLRGRAAWAVRRVADDTAAVATKLQSWWRGMAPRRMLTTALSCTLHLQAVFRGRAARKQVAAARAAIVSLQSAFRRAAAQATVRRALDAVVRLQACWRMQLVLADHREQLEHTAGLVLLWTLRDWCVRRRFLAARAAARTLTAWTRQCIARKHVQQRQAAGESIARGLAPAFKQWVARRSTAAGHMQRLWRGVLGRRVASGVAAQHAAALCITDALRRWVLCRRAAAAARLSAWFVGRAAIVRARRTLVQRREAALAIRAAVQGYCVRRRQARRELACRSAAAAYIARWWRRQRLGTCVEAAAQAVQRVWRGYAQRRQAASSAVAAELAAARRRIASAAVAASRSPANTLQARCAKALRTLKQSRSLAAVMRALLVLQSCTRLSVECCVQTGQQGGPALLLALVRSCNRSAPHQHVISTVLSILRNMASRAAARPSLSRCAEVMPVLVDVLQMFRDTLSIARPATRLQLVLATHEPHLAQRTANNRDAMKRLRSIHTIMARRAAMSARRAGGAVGTAGFGAGVVEDTFAEAAAAASQEGGAAQSRRNVLLLAAAQALGCASHLEPCAASAVADVEELLRILGKCSGPGAAQ